MNLPPDDLDREYHRASAADASRPSDRVRAAILEHARKVKGLSPGQVSVPGVDLSAPAANDARWRWKAAAGIAAVGFAGVLAVLLYRGNPDPQPVATASLETADAELAAPQTKAAPREPAAPAPAPARQRATAPEPQREEAARATEQRSDERVAATMTAPVTAPPLRQSGADAGEVDAAEAADAGGAVDATEAVAAAEAAEADSATGFTARDSIGMAPVALAAAGARAPVALPSANAIVRQHFPEALDSDEVAAQYWVLMNRDGSVLRSGQRNSTDQGELIGFLESSFAGIRTDEVQMHEFVNQRGRRVVIAQVFLAEGSPAP